MKYRSASPKSLKNFVTHLEVVERITLDVPQEKWQEACAALVKEGWSIETACPPSQTYIIAERTVK